MAETQHEVSEKTEAFLEGYFFAKGLNECQPAEDGEDKDAGLWLVYAADVDETVADAVDQINKTKGDGFVSVADVVAVAKRLTNYEEPETGEE